MKNPNPSVRILGVALFTIGLFTAIAGRIYLGRSWRDVEDGQVSYQRKIAPAEIFTFYQETMAARGWQPNSWFAGQKDQIAYTKGNRVALIYYTPTPDGTTVLTLMVGTQYPPK